MSAALAETVAVLGRLIAYPTVSSDGNLEMIADLAAGLEAAGARVEVIHSDDRRKANVFATMGPDAPGGLVLSGHTDVVPVTDQDWTHHPFLMHEAEGRLYGRGACDMKGFIAACMALAPEIGRLELRRPIHFAFTYDEEVGCLGARSLVTELQAREIAPAMALIGEPTMMRVIEGHKGCCEYTVQFTGLEGHGSAPERGVNAAEYAVRYVTRLLELRQALMLRAPEGSRFDPPWTTINVGRVSGGHAHNVIAGKAEVEWEMRPVQDADRLFVREAVESYVEAELLPAMRAVCPDADISTQVIGEVAGLEPVEKNAIRDLVAGLLGANGADVVPFGTEAGLFQQMGMSVVVCGPGSIEQAHKPDEFVSLDQLAACLDMVERLTQSFAQAGGVV